MFFTKEKKDALEDKIDSRFMESKRFAQVQLDDLQSKLLELRKYKVSRDELKNLNELIERSSSQIIVNKEDLKLIKHRLEVIDGTVERTIKVIDGIENKFANICSRIEALEQLATKPEPAKKKKKTKAKSSKS